MKLNGQETGKRQFVLKKAYEISYAAFRVGSRMGNPALKEHLERQALSLLDAATVENYAWVSTVSRAIEYLVRFGNDVGLINEANAEMIIAQLGNLNGSIVGPEKPATVEEVPLGDIFSGHDPLFTPPIIPARRHVESGNAFHAEPGNPNGNESGNRQTAILEKIRQSGNCRLKDIQELLPDCSERTIRYDLQSLIERNLLERVGAGGPAVFYRLRQSTGGGSQG